MVSTELAIKPGKLGRQYCLDIARQTGQGGGALTACCEDILLRLPLVGGSPYSRGLLLLVGSRGYLRGKRAICRGT